MTWRYLQEPGPSSQSRPQEATASVTTSLDLTPTVQRKCMLSGHIWYSRMRNKCTQAAYKQISLLIKHIYHGCFCWQSACKDLHVSSAELPALHHMTLLSSLRDASGSYHCDTVLALVCCLLCRPVVATAFCPRRCQPYLFPHRIRTELLQVG